MDFDAAEIIPPRHASPAVLDEGADVLRPPNGNARAKLVRFGKAPVFDARPPRFGRAPTLKCELATKMPLSSGDEPTPQLPFDRRWVAG
jgi:hypothetical protein